MPPSSGLTTGPAPVVLLIGVEDSPVGRLLRCPARTAVCGSRARRQGPFQYSPGRRVSLSDHTGTSGESRNAKGIAVVEVVGQLDPDRRDVAADGDPLDPVQIGPGGIQVPADELDGGDGLVFNPGRAEFLRGHAGVLDRVMQEGGLELRLRCVGEPFGQAASNPLHMHPVGRASLIDLPVVEGLRELQRLLKPDRVLHRSRSYFRNWQRS